MDEHSPFSVDHSPDSGDVRFLADQINAYNVVRTGVDNGRDLAIVLRDEHGIFAGIYGFTWGGVLEVKLLWVREDVRGHGLGTQLLMAAEQEAIERGCVQALLDTHSFQAPELYQREGYEVYGVVEDYPIGHTKVFLKKRLVEGPTAR